MAKKSKLLEYADDVWKGREDSSAYHTGVLRREGLHEIAEGVHMWPAFGNVYAFETEDGLFWYDTGDARTAGRLFDAVRTITDQPLHTAVYSHGHIDHIYGTVPFDTEAAERGLPRPRVVAHEAVLPRFDRYVATHGWNTVINQRQFQSPGINWPTEFRRPDTTFSDRSTLRVGDLEVHLRHGKGETDDAAIAWIPERGILCCGDFFIWASPNAGNPQKVQRYAREWAESLRWMAGLGAELLLPGHGLPIVGAERVRTALSDSAALLETLHDQTVTLMNAGATLDEVLSQVTAPAELMAKPYLNPSYDEPEFVVRGIWRLYGGWYDGDPSRLKPAGRGALAREVAQLAGSAEQLGERAKELLARGDDRLAGHFAQMAVDADPDSKAAHQSRTEIFRALEKAATSTMSKGVFGWAVAESRAVLEGSDRDSELRARTEGRAQWAF